MAIYEEGIDFIDGNKINVVISFCSQDGREHLDSLVEIIENFEENELLKKLKRCKNSKDVLKCINI